MKCQREGVMVWIYSLFFAHSAGLFCWFVHLSLFGLMYTIEWFSHFFLSVVMCFVIIMIILSFFLHFFYFSYGMISLYFSSAAEQVMLSIFILLFSLNLV